jgi:hypothetical protein
MSCIINWGPVVKKYSNKAKLKDHSNMKRILQVTGIDWIHPAIAGCSLCVKTDLKNTRVPYANKVGCSESGLQLSLGPRFANFNITN